MATMRPRIGFTLIELLVVVAIISLLLGLTAFYFPTFQRREGVANGVDVTSGALLTAKMRAKRDGRPTGVRLGVDPNLTPAPNPNQFNMLTFIQQPDDFAQGRYQSGSGNTATFTSTVSFTGNVNPGDYLEINGGGMLYHISAVGTNTLTVDDNVTVHPLPTVSSDVASTAGPNYRVIRAAQVLASEPTISLPAGVIYDFGTYSGLQLSQLPQTTVNNVSNYDILFAPSGTVIGTGANSPIYLAVRQADGVNLNPYGSDLTANYATMIAVEPHTGMIASHPVDTGSDPYAFFRDGQSSGM